ncbi:MAG: MBL fold metallo-hydrolase [bacterium]|nr:MBL fold metallo-hydrolase [bacterium]MCP5066127.1 MBL fold metallo-hydrolase [bacterium]
MSEPSDLYFHQIPAGEMANFVYLVGSRETRECVLVDPAWNVAGLLDQAAADEMNVVGALVTHYHQDHVGGSVFGMEIEGLAEMMARHPVPVHVNKEEADGLRQVTGVSESDIVRREGGDTIELGAVTIRLLHTPGHTPGSQCFLVETAGGAASLVSGDTLFLGSCGRVDLPGGDPEALYHSLHDQLGKLPDETLLYPGHLYSTEPSSTLAEQKRTNPYLRVTRLEDFLGFMGY